MPNSFSIEVLKNFLTVRMENEKYQIHVHLGCIHITMGIWNFTFTSKTATLKTYFKRN